MAGLAVLAAIGLAIFRWFRLRALRRTNIQLKPMNGFPPAQLAPSPMPLSNQPVWANAAAMPQGVNPPISQPAHANGGGGIVWNPIQQAANARTADHENR